MQDFEAEILGVFLDEATESLAEWERCCFVLGKGTSADAIAQLFRCAHNMKGSARSVGLAELGEFIHIVEELILNLKQGDLEPNPDVVKVLLRCEETLRVWLENLRENKAFVIEAPLRAEVAEQIQAVSKGTQAVADIVNATAGDIVFIDSPSQAPVLDSAPGKVAPAPAENKAPEPPSLTSLPSATTASNAESVRVPARRIDALIQLVGELSIQSSIIEHASAHGSFETQACQEAIGLLSKLCRDLQSRTLGFRMQTLHATMQRLERVARDVASELGKDVEIDVVGAETELDKTVIERMVDPLVHMVRNALDHGVETTEERARSGKTPRAKMTLSARQDPDGVRIVIADDGRGLDAARLRAKAVEKGLIAENASLSEQQTFALIFLQGFSTAAAVTNISGRGVGMEVVKKAVTELGGRIEIESALGKGTAFSVSLPTSVSILDALVVWASGNRYAVPLNQVDEILSLGEARAELATNGSTVFRLRDEILPLQDLSQQLATRGAPVRSHTGDTRRPILVVRNQGRRLGFAIDSIATQQQVVVRKLGGKLEGLVGFVGGTILGDGEPGFILDIPYFTETFFKQGDFRT
ncbi:MAG: chemotaxis protein CheA [Silvanigrellales bacterium]|nr:chemotaxis protein CheA [Silvanigrellales bacterium]